MTMKLISVKLPIGLIEAIDDMVRDGFYPSRSAVIRTALVDLIKKERGSLIQST